jgi:phosphoglycolate phosphatase
MMVKQVIIFDFDGTIADSHDLLVDITNRLSGEFGYAPVEPDDLLELKHLSSREIVDRSKISIFKLPFLLRRVKLEVNKEIVKLKPIPGIDRSLIELKKRGYQLGIITSNAKDNVVAFLENNHLEDLFDFIYATPTIFGKHKVINRFLSQNQISTDRAIYVGDETRDIKAAKVSKIKVVAVGWGFNSSRALAQYQPDFLVDRPRDLVDAIEQWQASSVISCPSSLNSL